MPPKMPAPTSISASTGPGIAQPKGSVTSANSAVNSEK